MNEIHVILPCKHLGIWVFDDARVDLARVPFMASAKTWIERVVADIPDAHLGFTSIFPSATFP